MAPAVLPAQSTDSVRSHVVRAGETLWRIAAEHLGDGHRWREILALNASVIRSAQALPVGVTVRIPGSRARRTAAPTAPPPRQSPTVGETPAATAPPPPSEGAPPPPAPDSTRRTIFYGATPGGGFVAVDSSGTRSRVAAVPAGVFEGVSAPFVGSAATFAAGGTCVSLDPSSERSSSGVMLYSRLTVRPPAIGAATPGSRWVLVRRGPEVRGLGTIAIPTGVVRIVRQESEGATAEVLAQFDAITCTDAVLPLVMQRVPDAKPAPVANGASGTVAWVAGESLLASLQDALILDIGSAQGVQAGDVVTVFTAGGDSIVANATVVRAGSASATALVVRQARGSLAPGLRVRVTEKIPPGAR